MNGCALAIQVEAKGIQRQLLQTQPIPGIPISMRRTVAASAGIPGAAKRFAGETEAPVTCSGQRVPDRLVRKEQTLARYPACCVSHAGL